MGEILRRVESSPVVGADETGEYPDGGSHWMWVFQNEVATYIFPDPSRGKNAMYEHFPDGLPGNVPVTDRHSSCFNMRLACHQLCLAHLVRHKEHILKLLRNPRVPSDNIPPNVPYRADRMFFNTTVLYQSKAMIF